MIELSRRLLPLLLTCLAATVAAADQLTTYNIDFQVTPPTTLPPPTGSFTYDSTNPLFSSVSINYDGFSFGVNFNVPNFASPNVCNGAQGAMLAFDVLSDQCPVVPGFPTRFSITPTGGMQSGLSPDIAIVYGQVAQDAVVFAAFGSPDNASFAPVSGTLSITPAPEPATGCLILFACMSMIVAARRGFHYAQKKLAKSY